MSEPIHTVKHRTTLLRLQRDGLIKEPSEHVMPKGTRWGAKCYYVDSTGKLGSSWVRWQGYDVRLVYRNGCFFPFVEYRHAINNPITSALEDDRQRLRDMCSG